MTNGVLRSIELAETSNADFTAGYATILSLKNYLLKAAEKGANMEYTRNY